jgi:hypothetical protein
MYLKTATSQAHLILIIYIYLCAVPITNYEYCDNSVNLTLPMPVAVRCEVYV